MKNPHYEVLPIGWVESPLTDRAQAPRQGDEGAPPAWLAFEPAVTEGIRDLRAGTEIMVLTGSTGPSNDSARQPAGLAAATIRRMTPPPDTGLPRNIGAPATRALIAAGYTELRQLAHVPAAELKNLHGVGPRALKLLQEALEQQGMSLG